MKISELGWVVAGAAFAMSMGACTTIIGDGFVIEDEDDDDDGPNPPPPGDPCLVDCSTCYSCYCQGEFDACLSSLDCQFCIDSGDPSCPDPTFQTLLSCAVTFCSGCDTSGA